MEKIKAAFKWASHRISHKLEHVSLETLKSTLKEHGLALVVIIVLWEVLEDIVFPALFTWLGMTVHPFFLAGAPIAWLLCLHPIAVPMMWAAWIKIKKGSKETDSDV